MDVDPSEYGDEESFSSNSGFDSDEGSVNIARDEIKLLNVVRAIVILILLTIAFIAAETVFVIATMAEQNNFRAAYTEASNKIYESFYENIDKKLWVSRSFATELSSSSKGMSWPNVSFTDFAIRSVSPLYMAETSVITFSPLVFSAERVTWEQYAEQMYPVIEGDSRLSSSQRAMAGTDLQGDRQVYYFPTGRNVGEGIYRFQSQVAETEPASDSVLVPIWQMSPVEGNSSTGIIGTMYNQLSNAVRERATVLMFQRKGSTISTFLYLDTNKTDYAEFSAPRSVITAPIYQSTDTSNETAVGAVNFEFRWEPVLSGSLPDEDQPLDVVVENYCGGMFTFEVSGVDATFQGEGDLHNANVDGYSPTSSSYEVFAGMFDKFGETPISPETGCNYRLSAYASSEFKGKYLTSNPMVYRGVVLAVFLSMVLIFVVYNCLVERSQKKVVQSAQRSDAIVRSLFPEAVRDRLYEDAVKKEALKRQRKDQWRNVDENGLVVAPKNTLKKMLNDGNDSESLGSSMHGGDSGDPIADLFPNCTILFADLAGFTAWSSEREPAQVFTLLETIYRAMDKVAKKLKVFKVETVGDCYVAATGLPEPQDNHVEIMCRFARTCVVKVNNLTKTLESQLGPGTGELAMRVGLHSGPVTAGVLRGQKARFQLFGDTMNMASRMESNGLKNKVHLSAATAKILIDNGLQHWVTEREDKVSVKGKGECQTFWLSMGASSNSYNSSSSVSGSSDDGSTDFHGTNRAFSNEDAFWAGTGLESVLGSTEIDGKLERLIDWNVEVLLQLLQRNMAAARARGISSSQGEDPGSSLPKGGPVLDEVQMSISLPEFDAEVDERASEEDTYIVPEVKRQLRQYVTAIATGYQQNSFHNFEHASHVILSANKLLKRIMHPEAVDQKESLTHEEIHEHTYGISSDTLAQFAIVFSALVHDVGHKGVPNGRLAVEEPDVAELYINKSVAEQRSVDVAWQLLMLPDFDELRKCIYTNEAECHRFRSFLVNSVLATDIFDKELKALRNSRWEQAFHGNSDSALSEEEISHRRATIVIEHIIQASDVSHTMQHWRIYVKWNARLFEEMYFAYLMKRSDKDPSEGWYGGEIWFFDNYVIPLAGKLSECGVFGVSSHEYLNYATENRKEWELKGREIVENMKENAIKEAKKRGIIGKSRDSTDGESGIPKVVAHVKEQPKELVEVVAPAGKLGITLDSSQGSPIVDEVSEDSPLFGKIMVGDVLVEVDSVDTRTMASSAIAELLAVKANEERKFVVER